MKKGVSFPFVDSPVLFEYNESEFSSGGPTDKMTSLYVCVTLEKVEERSFLFHREDSIAPRERIPSLLDFVPTSAYVNRLQELVADAPSDVG